MAIITFSGSDACKPENIFSRILRKLKKDDSLDEDDLVRLKQDVFVTTSNYPVVNSTVALWFQVEVAWEHSLLRYEVIFLLVTNCCNLFFLTLLLRK